MAVAISLGVVAELVRVHGGVAGSELASSWQLVDLGVLRRDPLGAVWYLHTQPPLHNLVVGASVAWSPFPPAGTVFVLYAATLVGLALALEALLVRGGVPSLAAGAVAGFAVAEPSLLHTIALASYEVPLALLVVLLLLAIDVHLLRAPTGRSFAVVVLAATALTLTRSLFHPVWLAGVLALVATARRIPRRSLLGALAVPLVLVGGWMVKNEVLFHSFTLSSWDGFNLQRGVTGPMDRATVEADVAAGRVSPLALERPWQQLGAYGPGAVACRPAHRHPAASRPTKGWGRAVVANFDDECYLPLYARARRDALTLVLRHPGAYLARRATALELSHATTPVGTDPPRRTFLGERTASRSWMDHAYDPLLATERLTYGTAAWNQPVMAGGRGELRISWALVAVSAIVLGRGIALPLGSWVARRARRRRTVPIVAAQLQWLVVGATYAFVVLGGDLVELGENGRFRSMLDPAVAAVLVAGAWRVVRQLGRGRAEVGRAAR